MEAPEESVAATWTSRGAAVPLTRTRFERNAGSSLSPVRTGLGEVCSVKKALRRTPGTPSPTPPPARSVEVRLRTVSWSELVRAWTAPQPSERPKTDDRTSAYVIVWYGSRVRVFSGPPVPSVLFPRNFSVIETGIGPRLWTVRSDVQNEPSAPEEWAVDGTVQLLQPAPQTPVSVILRIRLLPVSAT